MDFITKRMNYKQESITPYGDTRSKTEQVEQMFDNIAHSYDLLNHVLSLGIDRNWRRKSIEVLKDYPHGQMLDLATGTGDFAILACSMLHPQKMMACDISDEMMAVGRQKAQEKGWKDIITFQREDGTCMSFPDATFDIATIAFGVRNFHDLDLGLKEIKRVLKPSGQLLILELSTPHHPLAKAFFYLYAHFWMPMVGRLLSKDRRAYSYLPATMEGFPQGEEMAGILRKAGFTSVRFRRYTFGLCTCYLAS